MVIPKLASGIRDYLPDEVAVRSSMLATIQNIFERFGFVRLETPAIERLEVLTGGDPNFSKQLFKLAYPNDGLALRFDLTVPLARVVAQYSGEIKKPFKRYQVGAVWRAEKAQAGRFREFLQFDADIVGSSSVLADAEIVSLMYETLSALGLTEFTIKVNTRKLLNSLAEYAGFDPLTTNDVLRTVDKLDKIGWDAVQRELAAPLGEGGRELTDAQIVLLQKFFAITSSDQAVVLELLGELVGHLPCGNEGIEELARILHAADCLEVPREKWKIDVATARGLSYYTGPVFEATLNKLPEIGSVFSGGRYDDLVSRFSDISVPATGASVGVDRLFEALRQLGSGKSHTSAPEVLLLNFDADSESGVQRLSTLLRRAGMRVELYLGNEITLKAQLAYATKRQAPFVIFLGERERANNIVTVKDMASFTQVEVAQDDVVTFLQQRLVT